MLHQQHLDYVMSMFDSGKAVLAGRVTDGGEIDGVFIFRAKLCRGSESVGRS